MGTAATGLIGGGIGVAKAAAELATERERTIQKYRAQCENHVEDAREQRAGTIQIINHIHDKIGKGTICPNDCLSLIQLLQAYLTENDALRSRCDGLLTEIIRVTVEKHSYRRFPV